jgi:ATP-binding cassette subfamily B protein/subfamily B ATP-binding cassette protein MsbA
MGVLVRQLARKQWKVLLVYFVLVVILGISEATLFATLYRSFSLLLGSSLPQVFIVYGLSRGQAFMLLLGVVLILQLIASSCRAYSDIVSGRFAARCQAEVLPRIHRYILSLSYGCVSGMKTGDLTHQANLAPSTINLEIEERIRLITESVLASVYLLVLVKISPWLLIMACFLGLGIALTQARLRPQIRMAAKEVEAQRRRVTSTLTADLQALRLIHSNACEAETNEHFASVLHGLEQKLVNLSRLRSFLQPTAEFLPVFAAVVLGILSWRLSAGRTEWLIPSLATFVLALQRLNARLAKMGLCLNLLTENRPRVDMLNELLNPEGKTFRRRGGRSFAELKHEICFDNVYFRYPNRSQDTLEGISFSLPCKATVALVGSSGAGKSTIVDLLVGLITPTHGSILVDGEDLLSLSLNCWQRSLGVVSQDVLMIHDTIAANIAFGLGKDVCQDQIHNAAVSACAADFIAKLPEGYDTVIGEHGHRLSGGQRQRISLARAILRQPQILILDEATSALDSHSESKVHAAIEAFSRGRTVLAIAHRLSSIRHADMILVIDAGKIIERGSHDQLIATSGAYASLWRCQVQGVSMN